MPNQNPIYVDALAQETPFYIDQQYANEMINITIDVQLMENGWQFTSTHSIFLTGVDKYPPKTPEPIDQFIETAVAVNNKKLSIRSSVNKFRSTSPSNIPPDVKYKLTIKAGATLLECFEKVAGKNGNTTDFNSLIRFKLQ